MTIDSSNVNKVKLNISVNELLDFVDKCSDGEKSFEEAVLTQDAAALTPLFETLKNSTFCCDELGFLLLKMLVEEYQEGDLSRSEFLKVLIYGCKEVEERARLTLRFFRKTKDIEDILDQMVEDSSIKEIESVQELANTQYSQDLKKLICGRHIFNERSSEIDSFVFEFLKEKATKPLIVNELLEINFFLNIHEPGPKSVPASNEILSKCLS